MTEKEQPNFFRVRREKLDLTQRAVALQLDMTDKAVGQWECEVTAPRITLADRLAKIYQVTPARMREEIALLAKRIAETKQAAHAG